MNLVSFIVPCFKQAHFLDEALLSVSNQTHTHWECIIVNDGSPDHTEAVARKWVDKDARFKYLYKENGGLSSARNFGIDNSQGEVVVTLDADDKYEPTFVEKALAVLQTNDAIGVVSCYGKKFKDSIFYDEFYPKGGGLDAFMYQNSAVGTSLFRKKCWMESGGYDENMTHGYEDWEFYIRVCQLDYVVHIIPEVLFFYRQSSNSMRVEAVSRFDTPIKKYVFLKHQELYKENFEQTLAYFFNTIDTEKTSRIKTLKKIDYKIGHLLLMPLRYIKSVFK